MALWSVELLRLERDNTCNRHAWHISWSWVVYGRHLCAHASIVRMLCSCFVVEDGDSSYLMLHFKRIVWAQDWCYKVGTKTERCALTYSMGRVGGVFQRVLMRFKKVLAVLLQTLSNIKLQTERMSTVLMIQGRDQDITLRTSLLYSTMGAV